MSSHNSQKTDIPLVVIVGPTAVGKTEVAIRLAERLDGEIVSADSRLFYRGMDIGTAKPTSDECNRVPHHMIDVAEPDEEWNLAIFQRSAQTAISEIHSRGHLPFLVGGTGQYIYAVVEGWQIPESKPEPELRTILENWAELIGPEGLHNRLFVLDPIAASRIDPRNLRRSIRALEVILRTGRRFSEQAKRRGAASPYRALMVGLSRPRHELYARIDARIESMMAEGFEDEIKALLQKGYDPDLPNFSAIGYRQMIAYVKGEISLEEAVILMKRNTRQFVRRQRNWFKENDPKIHWFNVGTNSVKEVEALIRSWLHEV
jgi:tRNA dimethylallyltransferase